MLFNSYIFIFLFLPICWAGYWGLVKKGKFSYGLTFLTVSSMVFYAYWNPPFLLLVLASVLFNYTMAGIAIRQNSKLWIYAAVVANLLLLGYFKYSLFFVETINLSLGTDWKIAEVFLPLGISFFTFHQITYLFDTFHRVIPRANLRDYTLYICFFPQLIAGPIVRAREFLPQIASYKGIANFWRNSVIGLSLFVMGLGKKVIVADYFAMHANKIFNLSPEVMRVTFVDSWVASLSYSFQLYFDFSGYSDMALGLALLFGFRLPMNFFSPYKAKNIAEFWRRWHMSMSYFFRDYLYIPMGGSRCAKYRQLINLFATMTLVGLWHGAGWTFILWGMLHGMYLAIHRAFQWIFGGDEKAGLFKVALSRGITFIAVVVGWMVFRATNVDQALILFKSMMGMNGIPVPQKLLPDGVEAFGPIKAVAEGGVWYSGARDLLLYLVVAYAACLALPSSMSYFRMEPIEGKCRLLFKPDKKTVFFFSLLFVISILLLNRVSEFLYFQF